MKKYVYFAVCFFILVLVCGAVFAQAGSVTGAGTADSGGQSQFAVQLNSGEKITSITSNDTGTASAFCVVKRRFYEEYLLFNGVRYGPYSSVMYETVSADGSAVLYADTGSISKKKIYLNGKEIGSWDGVEYMAFIPGTAEPSYKGIMYEADGSTSNYLIFGNQKEGPYKTLDIPIFSADGKHHTYRAKDDSKYRGGHYVHVDGKRMYGPYDMVSGFGAIFVSDNKTLYAAEVVKGKESLFLSGEKIVDADTVPEYMWNTRLGKAAYAWSTGGKVSVTDGEKVYGPYKGRYDDMAFSSDFSSFSFGIVREDGNGVDVYKDGQFFLNVPSLCEIIYSPDGKDIAFSTARLGGPNYVYYQGQKYDAFESMLFSICFSPDKKTLAFATQIKEKNYIVTTAGAAWGPYISVTVPSLAGGAGQFQFTAFDGIQLKRYKESF